MLLLGIYADLGALLFVAFLVPAALLIHNFWKDDDPMNRQNEMTMFQKDLAIAGGALLAFVLFATVGDEIGLKRTGPLFDISL